MSTSHVIFLLGLATYITIRVIFKRRSAGGDKTVVKSNAGDLALVALVMTGQIAIPILSVSTPLFRWASYALPASAVWPGACAMAAGLWLFWRAHADLGESWSVTLELNSRHRLVTEGVYRAVRHPMYASFFIMGLAQALLIDNWIAGCSALAAVAVLYVFRKPHEEAMLIEHFGDEYKVYMSQTGGIVPRVWTRRIA